MMLRICCMRVFDFYELVPLVIHRVSKKNGATCVTP